MKEQEERRIERLASFPQLNTNPILELDCFGAIIFHNDAAIEILKKLGLKKDLNRFLPKDIYDILKNLDLKRKEQLYREVEIEGLTFAENIHIVPEYNVVRIYCSDITKRKQSEEHIRKLHRVFEQSQIIVMITDIKGEIEYVNPMFTKITGYTFEEAIGKNPRILNSGKQSSEIYKEMWSAIKSGHVWKGEFCNKDKNGVYY
ncbi:MAG: PAS domain-containing protein [Candidatus Anammoxibacter sp.]